MRNIKQLNNKGFGILGVLIVILILAAIGGSGFYVYQHHKKNTSLSSKTSATVTTQTKAQSQSTAQTIQYLDIKEWGIKIPLSSAIKDAYYVVPLGISTDQDGKPSGIILGLTSEDNACGRVTPSGHGTDVALGEIVRVPPTAKDPVSGELYSQLDPGGVTVGGYYYGYISSSKYLTCASKSTLQSIDSAFEMAVKNMAPSNQVVTLDITQWGVHVTLDSTTAGMYYYINPNNPNIAYVSLKTIANIAPDCAADKGSLGAIGRLTETQQQAATANPSVLNQPGTIHIGSYWYYVAQSHSNCGNNAEWASIDQKLPGFNFQALLKTLNTLAAD